MGGCGDLRPASHTRSLAYQPCHLPIWSCLSLWLSLPSVERVSFWTNSIQVLYQSSLTSLTLMTFLSMTLIVDIHSYSLNSLKCKIPIYLLSYLPHPKKISLAILKISWLLIYPPCSFWIPFLLYSFLDPTWTLLNGILKSWPMLLSQLPNKIFV